jgi:hypothetical protein
MIDNALQERCDNAVHAGLSAIRPEETPYLSHPGNQGGVMCVFVLDAPLRSKAIPYSSLLSIDTLGEQTIALRYTHADVFLSLGRTFAGRNQLLDDLTNFRVALLRASPALRMEIRTDAVEERPERF